MAANPVLSKEFELIKKDLIALYDYKGMRASGAWADSLEVMVTEDRAILMGFEYSQQLETGRKPGKFPPIEAIKKWIQDKGVFSAALKEISLSSLAFLIARKIAKQGWKREGFGGVELISSVITEDRIQKIIDEAGPIMAVKYSTDLVILLKKLAT